MHKEEQIKIVPQWNKNKEEIWDELFAAADETPIAKKASFSLRKVFMYAAAAVLLLLLIVPGYMFLHTQTFMAAKGEHRSVTLPDGSNVRLNADSRLIYKPHWWRFSRDVEMEGEAYFEVTKGSRFTVGAYGKSVEVLGTSFNIFARSERYVVTCLTGKVNVSDAQQSVILTPGMQALYSGDRMVAEEVGEPQLATAWTTHHFYFIKIPLEDVLREIERQYAIVIERPEKNDYLYSGNFARLDDPKETLNIIGKAFGIAFKIKE